MRLPWMQISPLFVPSYTHFFVSLYHANSMHFTQLQWVQIPSFIPFYSLSRFLVLFKFHYLNNAMTINDNITCWPCIKINNNYTGISVESWNECYMIYYWRVCVQTCLASVGHQRVGYIDSSWFLLKYDGVSICWDWIRRAYFLSIVAFWGTNYTRVENWIFHMIKKMTQ